MADTFDSTDALVCIVVDCIAITLFVIGTVVLGYNSISIDELFDYTDWGSDLWIILSITINFIAFLALDISWYKWYHHQTHGDFEELLLCLS